MDSTFRSPLLWLSYAATAGVAVGAHALGGWTGVAVGGLLGAVLIYALVRRATAEMRGVTRATHAIARGGASPTQPRSDGSGSFQSALASLSGDVAQNLRRIAEERYRLELVLGAVPDGIVVLNSKGRIRHLNEVARRLLDIPPDRSEPAVLKDVCQSPELGELLGRTCETDKVYGAEFSLHGRTLEVKATLFQPRAGIVLVVRDITEIRRLENVRRDFVANVSHELKTPLTSIRAYVETLLDGGLEDTVNNERFLRKIDEHATRLTMLLTDLLSLSRIESGRAIDERSRVAVSDPLLESLGRLSSTAEDEGIELAIDVPSDRVAVLGDREALQQILDNLIHNAITYSEPGDKVSVDVSNEENAVTIRVADQGIGIPDEDLPRIFERFYRVDKARSRAKGGTGLGLSIVKHYVQALGGEIDVASRVDEGTTFTIRLPQA